MKKKRTDKPPILEPLSPDGGEAVWYHAGLCFTCRGCGRCCTGAPGYVWVTDEEIDTLAEHFSMNFEEFEEVYVRKIGKRKSLREFQNYDCVFFDRFHKNCKVYTLRPGQCQTWPFWNSNLETPEAWEQISRKCPGCGVGEMVVSAVEIERRREVVDV